MNLLRALIRKELRDLVKKYFTKEKLQSLVWKWFGERVSTKKMVTKIAPSVRQKILDLATVDASGNVALTAERAQAIVAYVYLRTKEQME